MQPKRHFIYYLNHKNLIGEIEQYGYVFTVKNLVYAYLAMVAGSVLAAYLFKLTFVGYMVICATSIILTPLILLYSYRAMYEQRRFSDASKYIEKMLYYFKSSGKVLDSLQNASVIFQPGVMKTTIDKAIEFIQTQNTTNIEEKALKIIEVEFPNNRIRRLHKFMLGVEENGGDPTLGIDILLLERKRWTSEVVIQQKERKHLKKQFCIFSIFVVLLCLIFDYISLMYPTFNFDLSDHLLVRAASAMLIIVTLLLYTKLSKVIGKSWLEEDKLKTDEELEERYYDIVNYNERKEQKKSLIYALIAAIITAIIFLITANKILLAIGGAITIFLMLSYKIGYKIGRNDLKNDIEKAFPEWILQVALLMQYDNVPVSIAKSYDSAPGILKPEIRKMLISLDEEPTSPLPYNNFMSSFNLTDINEAMNTLYSVITAAGSDIDKEFRTILGNNSKIEEKAEQLKQEDRSARNELYIYIEVLFGCVLMLTDSVYMMLSFMSITSQM